MEILAHNLVLRSKGSSCTYTEREKKEINFNLFFDFTLMWGNLIGVNIKVVTVLLGIKCFFFGYKNLDDNFKVKAQWC